MNFRLDGSRVQLTRSAKTVVSERRNKEGGQYTCRTQQ